MKSSQRLLCAIAVPLSLALAAMPSVGQAQDIKRGDHYITVLTGPSSGIYFPIGGAFSTRGVQVMWPKRLAKMLVDAEAGPIDVQATARHLASKLPSA